MEKQVFLLVCLAAIVLAQMDKLEFIRYILLFLLKIGSF